MATKTITIDVDAYERLKSVQKPTESFGQTIKRVVRKPINLNAWFAAMDRAGLSRQAANAIARRPAVQHHRGRQASGQASSSTGRVSRTRQIAITPTTSAATAKTKAGR
jgi:hypothetical protein